MAQVKKISLAKVVGKVSAKLFAEGVTRVAIMDCIGVAVATKTGVSDYGEWTGLLGRFKAKNLMKSDAEYVEGVQCFLPDVALVPIKAALDNGAVSAEFGVRIIAVENADTQIGFEYECEPLIKAEAGSDPMDRLLAAAEKGIKALAAPAPAPAKAVKA